MQFPHCDSNILHAPGECIYCDRHPKEQAARQRAGINFTGHNDEDKLPCPAEFRRPLTTINKWGGNVAVTDHDHIYFVDYLSLIRQDTEKAWEEKENTSWLTRLLGSIRRNLKRS